MNLADLKKDELQKIREVAKAILDLALRIFPYEEEYSRDYTILSNDSIEIIKMHNVILIRENPEREEVGAMGFKSRYSFGICVDEFVDFRIFSTRYNTDNGRYVIRRSPDNSILKVNRMTVFRNTQQIGDEEYLDILSTDSTESEIFQYSLINNTEEMNVMILNHILQDLIPESGCVIYGEVQPITFNGYAEDVSTLLKAHESLEEIEQYANGK